MILNVITWNIRHGLGIDKIQDIDRICDELMKREGSIIAIQEIDRNAKRSKRIDQVEYIAEKLKTEFAFARFWGHKTGGDYGLATFSKYPIVNHEDIVLNPRGTTSNNRALHCEILVSGTLVNHYNFHFPSTRNATFWRNFYKIRYPKNSILTGDFNLNTDAADIIKLKSKWNDINEQDTHPDFSILDYSFSDMVPTESRVYETIASDHSLLETKYYL